VSFTLEMMRLADRIASLKRKMHVALASTWSLRWTPVTNWHKIKL